jgi:hypothetical protein
MLSVLRSQLKEKEMVVEFDYRNLAPLYAAEEMRICVRRDREKEDRFDVWIEGVGGGYAVKGSAITSKPLTVSDIKSLKGTDRSEGLKSARNKETGEQTEDLAPH